MLCDIVLCAGTSLHRVPHCTHPDSARQGLTLHTQGSILTLFYYKTSVFLHKISSLHKVSFCEGSNSAQGHTMHVQFLHWCSNRFLYEWVLYMHRCPICMCALSARVLYLYICSGGCMVLYNVRTERHGYFLSCSSQLKMSILFNPPPPPAKKASTDNYFVKIERD